jgi:hypothetical protein
LGVNHCEHSPFAAGFIRSHPELLFACPLFGQAPLEAYGMLERQPADLREKSPERRPGI